MNVKDLKMFDLVLVEYPETNNSEQGGIRPSVIVQNDIGNKYSPTLIVLPITKEIKKANMPTHCIIHKTAKNGLKVDSMVLAEQVRVVDKQRITGHIGSVDDIKVQNEIISAYLANITGKKSYNNTIWSKVTNILFTIVKEGNRVAV